MFMIGSFLNQNQNFNNTNSVTKKKNFSSKNSSNVYNYMSQKPPVKQNENRFRNIKTISYKDTTLDELCKDFHKGMNNCENPIYSKNKGCSSSDTMKDIKNMTKAETAQGLATFSKNMTTDFLNMWLK